MLRKSMRFSGAIADLAMAVNACDVEAANAVLAAHAAMPSSPVHVVETRQPQNAAVAANWLSPQLLSGYDNFVKACGETPSPEETDTWALRVLSAYGEFQFLTALRAGPYGQKAVNTAVAGHFGQTPEHWYHGRPVMVTANDYSFKPE